MNQKPDKQPFRGDVIKWGLNSPNLERWFVLNTDRYWTVRFGCKNPNVDAAKVRIIQTFGKQP